MSLWKIAWRSIQQRGIASMLTAFSMALGVMLVVMVLSMHGVISKSFRTNSSLGYHVIIGAKGNAVQLTLNSVYYLSKPIENMPYDYFLEFMPAEQRTRDVKNSVKYHAHQALWDTLALQNATMPVMGIDAAQLTATGPATEALAEIDQVGLRLGMDGKYCGYTELAIPLALGDFYGPFRVIGTTSEMFDKLSFGPDRQSKFTFRTGRNFKFWTEQHGYFESVVGHAVAEELGLGIGDTFSPSHGADSGDVHVEKFTVVGILDESKTPNDRALFVNIEGFLLMGGHAQEIERDKNAEPGKPQRLVDRPGADGLPRRLPLELREVTAILIRWSDPLFAQGVSWEVNKGGMANSLDWSEFRPQANQKSAQAVSPIEEIHNLFQVIIKPIQTVLLGLAVIICFVSGISILVSIYNSMSDRKHEIAVMRALGAGRGTVMSVILFESIMLSLGGGLVGWVAAHSLNALASPFVEAKTGVAIAFWDFAPALDLRGYLGRDAVRLTRIVVGVICGLLFLVGGLDYLVARIRNRDAAAQYCLLAGVVLLPLLLLVLGVSIEIVIIPALVVLAMLVGVIPAVSAYRTDVAKSLGG